MTPGRPRPASLAAELRGIRRELRSVARPSMAAEMRRYLGSPLPTLAVAVPEVHRIVRGFRRRTGPRIAPALLPLLRALWAAGTYDERLVAIELLDRYEEAQDRTTWELADRWVPEASGWALSDSLAAGPVAGMLSRGVGRFPEMLRWAGSSDPWRRRASVYALHDLVLAGDLDRPFRLLERLVADPEPWVQRAVGTWLRECGKQDPVRTERFLRRHATRLAPRALTVAIERSSGALRAALRRARSA